MVALACAAGVALHDGASPAAAPLWGAGLLMAGGLAERGLAMPPDGQIDVSAIAAWLAGLGSLAAIGMAAGALVLLAGGVSGVPAVVGLAAGALLTLVPAALARRWGSSRGPADGS